MNRQERRANRRISHQNNKDRTSKLTPIPRDEWPIMSPEPISCWVSKRYMVQVYQEPNYHQWSLYRMSICRTTQNGKGQWDDKITWDEIQAIKTELGFGTKFGIEIYPRDDEVVNVANMRHIWLLPIPLDIGWPRGNNKTRI